jgi:hypothetical protein
VGRIIFGFLAGALSVLVLHQPIILILKTIGMIPATAVVYNIDAHRNAPAVIANLFAGFGFKGFPIILNSIFWGGLWGILFAFIHPKLPGGLLIIKGIIFGLLLVILSNWIVLPLIRGEALFAGMVPQRLAVGALLQAGFGLGIGLFYGLLRRDT